MENISKDKPALLLCNHQNALIDALIIASQLDGFAYFLTRAGVFKKNFVSKILASFNMLPIYRIRDGWSNLTNNNSVFEKCKELLHNKNTLVIFPEGSHNLARRVRPLSKGFTRIVFDTLEAYPDIDLELVPVGLNFVNAKDYVDSASIYVGNPIKAVNYLNENRNEAITEMRQDIHSAMSKLTTHLPSENYDELVKGLDSLQVDYLNPQEVNTCIESNIENCTKQTKSIGSPIKLFLKLLLKANVLLPYLLWKIWIQPKIKELEFTSTFRFAVAIILVPIYLILVSVIIANYFGFQLAIVYFLSVIALALLTVKL